MTRRSLVCLTVFCLMAFCTAAPMLQAQSLYNVNINTTGLNGTAGGLAFDFVSGDNVTPNNTALVTSFATSGTLAGSTNTNQGTASGNLPGTLTLRDSAFSESFRAKTFGNAISFTLSLTNNYVAPGAPDEFSFFLTDATNTGTVVTTNDPTGANALFIVDLNGTGQGALTVFTPSTTGVSFTVRPTQSNVPEPSSSAFAVVGLISAGVLIGLRKRPAAWLRQ